MQVIRALGSGCGTRGRGTHAEKCPRLLLGQLNRELSGLDNLIGSGGIDSPAGSCWRLAEAVGSQEGESDDLAALESRSALRGGYLAAVRSRECG